MKYFSILWAIENDVGFEIVPWKNVWFCFISTVWVHFSHKTKKFRFWTSLKYFNIFWSKKLSDLNMSCETVSDLVEALLFEQHFDKKLRNIDFKLYWNSLIFQLRNLLSDQSLSRFFLPYLYFLTLLQK